MRHRTLAAFAVALLPLAAGCGTTGMTGALVPSAATTTTIVGWERWLQVHFAMQTRPGGQEIDGYVHSLHGSPLANVKLLAQALDASGNVVGQKLEWLPGIVPGLQRAYFRIPAMPAAASYRVTVWQFETVESPGFL